MVERKETLAEDVTEAYFNSYITAANSRISPFDLEIRSTLHQTSRQRIYALINSTSDPIMQLATAHTADEISFLKRLLDAMFETFNTTRQEVVAITSMQAMKLAKAPNEDRRETQNGSTTQGSSGQGLTLLQAEKMLKALVDGGWFEKSRKGFYSLSPRALMELRGWLLETYNHASSEDEDEDAGERINRVKVCVACKEIMTSVSLNTYGFPKPRSFSIGSKVLEEVLSLSIARHLHPELLPRTKVDQVPPVQEGVGRRHFCWRARSYSARHTRKAETKK